MPDRQEAWCRVLLGLVSVTDNLPDFVCAASVLAVQSFGFVISNIKSLLERINKVP